MNYNYLRPHTALDDKTPAEVAGIVFPYKNWADITRHKPSKPVVIEHKPRGSLRLEPTHIGRPKRQRISPPMPRISKPTPRLHHPKGGLYMRKTKRGTMMSRHHFRGAKRVG